MDSLDVSRDWLNASDKYSEIYAETTNIQHGAFVRQLQVLHEYVTLNITWLHSQI